MSITDSSVGELVSQLQRGDVSSVELTTAYLDAIEARDEKVGAFLHVDREAGTAAFNHSVVLENVYVDGTLHGEAVLNRVGYVVARVDRAYLIELQYLSTQPEELLRDLQSFFRSVRLLR